MRDAEEIREDIQFMRQRLRDGQGALHSPMCRLSLPAAEDLMAHYDEATAEGRRKGLEEAAGLECRSCKDGIPLGSWDEDNDSFGPPLWDDAHLHNVFHGHAGTGHPG
jgi:hypothetical protein